MPRKLVHQTLSHNLQTKLYCLLIPSYNCSTWYMYRKPKPQLHVYTCMYLDLSFIYNNHIVLLLRVAHGDFCCPIYHMTSSPTLYTTAHTYIHAKFEFTCLSGCVMLWLKCFGWFVLISMQDSAQPAELPR